MNPSNSMQSGIKRARAEPTRNYLEVLTATKTHCAPSSHNHVAGNACRNDCQTIGQQDVDSGKSRTLLSFKQALTRFTQARNKRFRRGVSRRRRRSRSILS